MCFENDQPSPTIERIDAQRGESGKLMQEVAEAEEKLAAGATKKDPKLIKSGVSVRVGKSVTPPTINRLGA
jgi:hypothetical protein